MVYLLATYINNDKLSVTRSSVLYQGDMNGAMDALAQEVDQQLDEGCIIIDENPKCVVMTHRSQYNIGNKYTIIIQVYETAGVYPYYN